MKKIICALVAAVLAASMCSCGSSSSSDKGSDSSVVNSMKDTDSSKGAQSEKQNEASSGSADASSSADSKKADDPQAGGSGAESSAAEKQTEKTESSAAQPDSQSSDYKITYQTFHTYKYEKENRYYSIVELVNTSGKNLQLYKCAFNFFDNDGNPLGTLDSDDDWAPAIIAPGEKGYFYAYSPSARIPSKVSLDNGIKLVPEITVKETKHKIYDMPVSDVKMITDEDGSVRVSGKVGNTRDSTASLVVKVLFKDENDKVIAIESDYVSNIEPNTRRLFEATTYKKSDPEVNKRIKSYTVIARW